MSYHAANKLVRLRSACHSRLNRVRNTPPSVFALSMIPMVADSFGDSFIRSLRWRLACALRRMRLRVTSWSGRNNVLASERPHAYSIAKEVITRVSLAAFAVTIAGVWLSVSVVLNMIDPGLARCTRLNKGMQSHSTLFDPLWMSDFLWESNVPRLARQLEHQFMCAMCVHSCLGLLPFGFVTDAGTFASVSSLATSSRSTRATVFAKFPHLVKLIQ